MAELLQVSDQPRQTKRKRKSRDEIDAGRVRFGVADSIRAISIPPRQACESAIVKAAPQRFISARSTTSVDPDGLGIFFVAPGPSG